MNRPSPIRGTRPRRHHVAPGAHTQYRRYWRAVDDARDLRSAGRFGAVLGVIIGLALCAVLWVLLAHPTPAGAETPTRLCATVTPYIGPMPPALSGRPVDARPAAPLPASLLRPNNGGMPPRAGATAIPAKPVVGGAP